MLHVLTLQLRPHVCENDTVMQSLKTFTEMTRNVKISDIRHGAVDFTRYDASQQTN